jgi:hypothetical protein
MAAAGAGGPHLPRPGSLACWPARCLWPQAQRWYSSQVGVCSAPLRREAFPAGAVLNRTAPSPSRSSAGPVGKAFDTKEVLN